MLVKYTKSLEYAILYEKTFLGEIIMRKKIELESGNIIIFDISDAYCGNMYQLTKAYLKNGQLEKTFTLSMWDDYGFNALVVDDEEHKKRNFVSFDIPFEDPIYFCFHRFLNEKEEIVIDTDDLEEENFKTMTIRRKENFDIEIIFDNRLNFDDFSIEKFHVFIKNVMHDIRSKIDCNKYDTKGRLARFFQDVTSVMTEECHQITIDEYLLTKKYRNKV